MPWELLYRPSALPRQPAPDAARAPPRRRRGCRSRRRSTASVRILGVVASPTDCAPLDVAGERARGRAGRGRRWSTLGRVAARLAGAGDAAAAARGAARRQLPRAALRRPQRLHGRRRGRAVPRGRRRHARPSVDGTELANLLADQTSLRLVVLNSCEGARTTLTDPFAGVATTLVQLGVPAVVAMQFEISDEAAILFAEELYTNLIGRQDPIDAAVAEARKAIYIELRHGRVGDAGAVHGRHRRRAVPLRGRRGAAATTAAAGAHRDAGRPRRHPWRRPAPGRPGASVDPRQGARRHRCGRWRPCVVRRHHRRRRRWDRRRRRRRRRRRDHAGDRRPPPAPTTSSPAAGWRSPASRRSPSRCTSAAPSTQPDAVADHPVDLAQDQIVYLRGSGECGINVDVPAALAVRHGVERRAVRVRGPRPGRRPDVRDLHVAGPQSRTAAPGPTTSRSSPVPAGRRRRCRGGPTDGRRADRRPVSTTCTASPANAGDIVYLDGAGPCGVQRGLRPVVAVGARPDGRAVRLQRHRSRRRSRSRGSTRSRSAAGTAAPARTTSPRAPSRPTPRRSWPSAIASRAR